MFYLELFSALDRHKVDYLLIGGLAVSLHGVERATMDVDITVAMSPANLAALIDAAKELKLTPVLPGCINGRSSSMWPARLSEWFPSTI